MSPTDGARAAALLVLLLAGPLLLPAAPAHAARAPNGLSGAEVRCLALIAYTEAAVDGPTGMAAVIRVVRNRMADPAYPDDACAVIAQVAQFQPVAQSALLRRVVRDPEGYSLPGVLGLQGRPAARRLLVQAHRLARAPLRRPDPTGGALFFVNPDLIDPHHCPWFAGLRRTAAIGHHVFMAPRAPGRSAGAPPALACAEIMRR